MAEMILVGDIGGTNSRFGLVKRGAVKVGDIETLRNDDFGSLEEAVAHYVKARKLAPLEAAIAVAAPTAGDVVFLTNRSWSFTRASLRKAASAKRIRLLNDFEALALALPHLGSGDLTPVGGEEPGERAVKIVLGPGTGLGMAALVPLKDGGWMALPGEVGHVSLPVATRAEFDWREKMTKAGQTFTAEDALSGGGLLRMYRAIAPQGGPQSPEAVIKAALEESNEAAFRTVDQFVIWLARVAGDAAMAMQAKGGVYLAGGIVQAIAGMLAAGPFRAVFEDKGKIAYVMKNIPVYIVIDKYPALRGCAAALAE